MSAAFNVISVADIISLLVCADMERIRSVALLAMLATTLPFSEPHKARWTIIKKKKQNTSTPMGTHTQKLVRNWKCDATPTNSTNTTNNQVSIHSKFLP